MFAHMQTSIFCRTLNIQNQTINKEVMEITRILSATLYQGILVACETFW